MAADGSGAVRVVPLVNAFTKTDLLELETWIGMKSMDTSQRKSLKDRKIYDQYGLIAFVISLVFIYSCVIHYFFSLESLLFLLLLGFTINNIYYMWGCFMIMTGVTYFQKNNIGQQVILTILNKDNED